MSKKLISTVFYSVFALCFVIMLAIMVKGMLDQKADDKAQNERYEKMISAEGKTALTKEILEEDHDKYLKDASKSKRTFISLLVCFGAVVLMFFLTMVFNLVLNSISGARKETLIISFVSFIVVMIMFVGFIVVVLKVIVPKVASSAPEDEAYAFSELVLSDSEMKKEYVETGSGDNRRTETRISYFLIEENGNKIEVKHLFYERFNGPGVYYAGRTASGSVFSLYSGEYFIPAWD